jgi:hypothetical protein
MDRKIQIRFVSAIFVCRMIIAKNRPAGIARLYYDLTRALPAQALFRIMLGL